MLHCWSLSVLRQVTSRAAVRKFRREWASNGEIRTPGKMSNRYPTHSKRRSFNLDVIVVVVGYLV
jgi:hypothetical protein